MFVGVSPDFALDLSPLPASTPPNEPVRKIASVLSKSIKAASLGACAPIGWVTKINAYVMPTVTIKNTAASVAPIIKISCACISSGDLRRAGLSRVKAK